MGNSCQKLPREKQRSIRIHNRLTQPCPKVAKVRQHLKDVTTRGAWKLEKMSRKNWSSEESGKGLLLGNLCGKSLVQKAKLELHGFLLKTLGHETGNLNQGGQVDFRVFVGAGGPSVYCLFPPSLPLPPPTTFGLFLKLRDTQFCWIINSKVPKGPW